MPHTYTLDIENNKASFFIDGVLAASNISPQFTGQVSNLESFGAGAGGINQ